VHRFIDFYDEIDHFGLGMVIFPSIIQSLNGKIDIRYVPALDQLHQTLSPKLTPLSPNSKLEKKQE
jgi:hypothetical protein